MENFPNHTPENKKDTPKSEADQQKEYDKAYEESFNMDFEKEEAAAEAQGTSGSGSPDSRPLSRLVEIEKKVLEEKQAREAERAEREKKRRRPLRPLVEAEEEALRRRRLKEIEREDEERRRAESRPLSQIAEDEKRVLRLKEIEEERIRARERPLRSVIEAEEEVLRKKRLREIAEEDALIEKEKQVPDLTTAREEFARSEVALAREGLKGKKIEDVSRAEELAHIENAYRMAIWNERKSLAAGLEGLEDKEGAAKEALAKMTLLEAVKLYDEKTRVKNEERPVGFSENILRKAQKVERWYRNLRPRNKIIIAGALLAAGGAGSVVGGVVGAGVVGAALTGKVMQRALAGAGVGVAIESAIKNSQNAKERRSIEKAFGKEGAEEIIKNLENSNVKLDEALFRFESKQGELKVRRYIIAATGGGLLASGAVAGAFEYVGGEVSGLVENIRERFGVVPDIPSESLEVPLDDSPDGGLGPAPEASSIESDQVTRGGVELPGAETEPGLEPYAVSSGDTMYAILEKSFPEIAELKGRALHNAIENTLEVIRENPAEFGISSGDVNLLSVGDSIDLDKINDILESEGVDGQTIVDRAKSLMAEGVQSESVVTERVPNISVADLTTEAESVIEPGEVVFETMTPDEAMGELKEFFRQTPGYLTRTVALEEFMEMIEQGNVDAETFRSFEDGVLEQSGSLDPDRYKYEFDVIRQGESVYGADELGRVEQELGKAFDRLWGTDEGSAGLVESAAVVEEVPTDVDVPSEQSEQAVESSGVHSSPEELVLREDGFSGEVPSDPIERMNEFAPDILFSLTEGGETYEIRPHTLSNNTPYIFTSEGNPVGTLRYEDVNGQRLPKVEIFKPALRSNIELLSVATEIEKYVTENNISLPSN